MASTKSKSILRIHFGLVLGETLCLSAFVFELYRALSGNYLSWAYVVEWPLLAIYCVHMWRKLLQDERGIKKIVDPSSPMSAEPDPQLEAWNAYLEQVHGKKNQAENKRDV
jgi:hypothetical protein